MNLRVGIVMPLGEIRGGSEMMLWHLVSRGQQYGIEWQVIFLEDGPLVEQVRQCGVKAHLVPAGRLRQPSRFIATVRRIIALAKQERFDLLCNWLATAQLYGGIAARLAGIPAIWYQLVVPYDKNAIDRIATLLPARLIIAVSEASGKSQLELRPQRPIRVVYPGVELENFTAQALPSPTVVRQKLGLPLEGPIIGIVGRLQRWKGMHTVLRALPLIQQRYPTAKVVIVGGKHAFEPDYPDFLEQEIERLGIRQSIIMPGLQSNIPEWVQSFDVAIHASQDEPFGIVVIEAMALGKPMVATNTAGPTEIITPEVHGLLVPFEDDQALGKAILRYLDDPAFAHRIGEAAEKRAQDFAVSCYIRGMVDACRESVDKNPLPLTIAKSTP